MNRSFRKTLIILAAVTAVGAAGAAFISKKRK